MKKILQWLHDLIVGRGKDDRWLMIAPAGWRVEFSRAGHTQCTVINEDTTLFDHYCTGYAQTSSCAVFDSSNMPYRIAECREFSASKKIQVLLSHW